ncbi:DnaJ domain-containing protein [Desulfobacula toluolica]|uniref:Heat shock protein, DnaJ domain n=1 Tax=Desulfobacula toluolica (strain DSM 7467 / Tol2) TaxID=651182 RepID=K0NN84_DESTT|nr:DnaJ domain-containing protein [Desulfobacula toluolica]CCK82055.1 heat shock protein, DnaJ domain [Desulfobacula toluolica Tol2]
MNSKDYYRLLKIDRNATENDIKKAYRKLAMEFHPDVNTEENAEEKFKAISEAYAVLKDNQKRQIYDQTESTDFNGFGSMGNRMGRGMGRCMGRGMGMGMGKCSGIDALFQRRSRYSKRRPATPGVIPE